MSAAEVIVELPPLHVGQRQVHDSTARFRWLATGRRWGKTIYGSDECTETAVSGGRAWWVAPSYKMAGVGWRELRNTAKQIPHTTVREVDRIIRYPSGGEIQVRSADDPDSLRGDGLDLAVLDECAFMQERAWTEALSPALADRAGRALFISSPKGRNWFWRGWQAAATDDSGESAAFRFTTFDNPHLPQREKDRLREAHLAGKIPDRIYRQEYLAEFIDDTGGVFRRVVEAATARPQDQAQDGHDYVFGADWGKLNDYTVLTVWDATTRSMAYLDRFNRIDYTVQAQRLKSLAMRFPPLEVIAESNSMGEAVIEQLRQMDLPVRSFTTTAASKKAVIDNFALDIERGNCHILADEILVGELQAFEAKRLPTGNIRYEAPEGLHDDCVMSAALGWSGVSDGGSGCVLL